MKLSASSSPITAHSARKKRANRRRRMNPWLSLAIFACAGMFGAWGLFQFVSKVVHPYQLGFAEARRVSELQAKLDAQQARNADLAKQVAYLHSSEGAESEARRLGYHRPGEVVYLLDQAALDQTNAVAP